MEAGSDTWVVIETPDMNRPAHLLPSVMFYQSIQNHLQRDAVKRVIGFFVSHIPVRYIVADPLKDEKHELLR
jgi:hypothetical protein